MTALNAEKLLSSRSSYGGGNYEKCILGLVGSHSPSIKIYLGKYKTQKENKMCNAHV